jgi:hypothetical protein
VAWADDAKAALDSAESLWLDIATAQAQGGGMPTGLETVPGAFYHDKVGGWPVPAGSFPNPQTTINDALTAADGYFRDCVRRDLAGVSRKRFALELWAQGG